MGYRYSLTRDTPTIMGSLARLPPATEIETV